MSLICPVETPCVIRGQWLAVPAGITVRLSNVIFRDSNLTQAKFDAVLDRKLSGAVRAGEFIELDAGSGVYAVGDLPDIGNVLTDHACGGFIYISASYPKSGWEPGCQTQGDQTGCEGGTGHADHCNNDQDYGECADPFCGKCGYGEQRHTSAGGGIVIGTNLTFENGRSPTSGGAVCNAGSFTCTNCTFVNNTAEKGHGGAVSTKPTQTEMQLINATFRGNRILNSTAIGTNCFCTPQISCRLSGGGTYSSGSSLLNAPSYQTCTALRGKVSCAGCSCSSSGSLKQSNQPPQRQPPDSFCTWYTDAVLGHGDGPQMKYYSATKAYFC